MSWIELSLDTTHEAVDWVYTLLATIQFAGEVQVANYSSLDRSQNWTFTIRLYLPNESQVRAQVETIANLLSPLHRTGLTTELEAAVLEERPPCRLNALAYPVGRRFLILGAEAEARSQPDKIPLKISTALSFGSGLHPATVLSLKLIERYTVSEMAALDLGSGSGILSVAMAKLGAKVLALDNDAIAVRSTQATACLNGVASQVTVRAGSLGAGNGLGHWMGGKASEADLAVDETTSFAANFDLIAANIFAHIHIALASDYQRVLCQGGLLIAAGFTSDREADVAAAMAKMGLTAIADERSGEWVALALRLR
ncbi:MAG: 50S ribosomal protein L11 methyltransferase [Leptolyngbyaceae cyanobacterium CSU_1_3]|nr:50S ribosomal protein L11 methyltransferase [Leptolyngbyaceae cyanobacterium CSU_1_3]